MSKNLSREEVSRLRALLSERAAQGITPTEVSREFGCHADTAQTHARAIGVKVRRLTDEIRDAEQGKFIGQAPAWPGFVITKTTSTPRGDSITQKRAPGDEFEIPNGHRIKGVSALLDPDGRELAKWVKTREGDVGTDGVVEAVKNAMADVKGTSVLYPPPAEVDPTTFTVIPLVDWHVGLMAWARETGENYDLKIARDVILKAMAKVIALSPPSKKCVVLGIGDMLHADGYEALTSRSQNQLDVDGRYPKVLDTAVEMIRATVDMASQRFAHVTVRILPGNHDLRATVALNVGLRLLYENNERITFDNSPSYYWWHREGKVLLGATHGDKVGMKDLPIIMAHDNPGDWAKSTYRRVYTGHIHNERSVEVGGVLVTSMRSPVAKDAWHTFEGYRSGRSVYSDTYDVSGKMAASVKVNL